MTVKEHDFVARLLSEYENITGETHSKIAGDMDIPVSNYYLYRNGMGKPTGNTINKMVAVNTDKPSGSSHRNNSEAPLAIDGVSAVG